MNIRTFQITTKVLACAAFFACLAARADDAATNSITTADTTTNPPSRLVIVKAVYGDPSDPSSSSDVTAQVAGMVTNDSLTVDASNDNFGDPASGVCKLLKVDFKIDGVAGSKSVYERGTLKISPADKPDPNAGASKLVIRKATYGVLPDGDTIDVTSIITGRIRNSALNFTVSDSDLGDPAPDESKKLQVDYTLDGKDGSTTVAEGAKMQIPAAGS